MTSEKSAYSKGFTLLEVIVALAITGFLLGGLFSLLAGSQTSPTISVWV